MMNCAERLVEIFGSQAELARAFQLDRAVVHNWVKVGYVPARWAGEVERLTQGRISAVEVINEASAKNPVRVKSRPGDAPFGILSETDPMNQYAPAKRIYSFHPPQRTLMGPGPTEIHPRVLTTMSQPAIGYLDPIFVEMMEELKSLLRYVYQTQNPHKHGALVIVDAVTSLGGTPVKVDEWEIDAIYSASQKCLSCTPGLSPVSFSERVVEHVKKRKDKIHSWFMDMNLLLGYWSAGARTYHHTAPTNSLFALHEALLLIREEGLENAWARATRHHLALKAGLEAMGLKFLGKAQYQLPQMNAVLCPEGVNEEEVRKRLLNEFGIEIGAGLGPLKGKIWRFGLMGYSCRPDNVMLCLSALGSVLNDMALPVHVGDAEAAAHGAYAQMHVKDAQRKKRAA